MYSRESKGASKLATHTAQDGFPPAPLIGTKAGMTEISHRKQWGTQAIWSQSTSYYYSRQLAQIAYIAIFASINGEIAIIISLYKQNRRLFKI